jgi:hypothetical protein
MKLHVFDSLHLPHLTRSHAKKMDEDGDLVPIAAFVVGAPLVTLGCVSLIEILFAL